MRHRFSLIVHAALWVLVLTLAFVMQVAPLLLILTMFNMAVGISGPAALIAVPVALLGTLVMAFAYAERRRRKWRPSPVRVDEVRHQQKTRINVATPDSARDFRHRWLI